MLCQHISAVGLKPLEYQDEQVWRLKINENYCMKICQELPKYRTWSSCSVSLLCFCCKRAFASITFNSSKLASEKNPGDCNEQGCVEGFICLQYMEWVNNAYTVGHESSWSQIWSANGTWQMNSKTSQNQLGQISKLLLCACFLKFQGHWELL